MSSSRAFGAAKPVKGAFIVLVQGKLEPGQVASVLVPAFKKLAEHVVKNEANCLAYELSLSADDPDAFIIYERYTSKTFVEATHWQSEPFKAFMATMDADATWLTKSITTYTEADAGF